MNQSQIKKDSTEIYKVFCNKKNKEGIMNNPVPAKECCPICQGTRGIKGMPGICNFLLEKIKKEA